MSSVDDGALALKWREKRDVMMLSTFHDTSMVAKTRRSRAVEGGTEEVQKPAVVEDYNQHMGGVDKGRDHALIGNLPISNLYEYRSPHQHLFMMGPDKPHVHICTNHHKLCVYLHTQILIWHNHTVYKFSLYTV